MEDGTKFRAVDLPEANEFLLHIMAAVAQMEARAISARTKTALKAAKARGTLLGGANPRCRNLDQTAREKGAAHGGATLKTQALDAYADVTPTMQALRAQGMTMQGIADELNAQGNRTRTGAEWGNVQILRALKRAA